MSDRNSTELLPDFLRNSFRFMEYRTINIQYLYVGVKSLPKGKILYRSVFKTPHYIFARHVLRGEQIKPVQGFDSYSQYVSIHYLNTCSEARFRELIQSIISEGYDAENKPILVFKYWRRPFPFSRWDVADGFHRLSILAAMGERYIQVATLKQKKNIFQRFAGRIIRESK